MRPQDDDFEDGRSYGKWEITQKLIKYSDQSFDDITKAVITKLLDMLENETL